MVTQINHYHSRILLSRYIQKLKSIFLAATFILSLSFFSGNDIARADTFGCFVGAVTPPSTTPSTTCNSLPSLKSETKCEEGSDKDWHTIIKNNNSDVTVLSIHGGKIEAGTSEISAKLEDIYKWDRYNFEGHVKSQGCKDKYPSCKKLDGSWSNFCLFHITSNNFNDPDAESATGVVKLNPRAVSIHGCSNLCTPLIEVIKNGQPTLEPDPALLDKSNTICIGGRNLTTRNLVRTYINQYKGLTSNPPLTFVDTGSADTGAVCDPGILGTSLKNIVNKTSTNEGLQLEISNDIRTELVYDDIVADLPRTINNDLLRTIVYGGSAKGVNDLPLPILATNGTETYTIGSDQFNRYKLKVQNKSEYSTDLFAASPNLPACGLNTNSSRTWVNIYNANGDTYIYGFCALGSPNDLDSIWFAVKDGSTPPAAVYITLEDRLNNRIYRSNRVKITP